MWISLESLLRGQYFYTSVRIASGLLIIALGFYVTNDVLTAAAVTSGALCLSAADTPSPWRHKILEVLAALIIATTMYSLTWVVHDKPIIMGIFIFFASLILGFSPLYGKNSIPISLAGTFSIVLALGTSSHGSFTMERAIILYIYGGSLYCLYALISSRFFVHRLNVQLFAECAFEVAKYLSLRARLYAEDANYEELQPEIVHQQAVVIEKQQKARDFIFRSLKKPKDRKLAKLLIMEVDFFETLVAGDTDYEMVASHFGQSEIMLFLHDLMVKMSKNIVLIAVTALRGKSPRRPMSYKAEIFAIEHYLNLIIRDKTKDSVAVNELSDIIYKISICTEKLDQLKKEQDSEEEVGPEVLPSINLMAFTTSYILTRSYIKKHLSWTSPHARYAIRAAIAMEAAYLIGQLLNMVQGFTVSRSYWIFLTISVVLRANYSTTVKRRTDRVVGSVLGSTIAALLLYTNPSAPIVVLCLFLAQVTASTFVTIDYRITAASASIVALVQIAFLNPGQPLVFWERIIDTVIGALIAYIASFLLPRWESRNIPQLIREVLEANAHYMRVVLSVSSTDETFRLARKKMLHAMANLSTAFERMMREPSGKRIAAIETSRFITLNYLFSARIASISILLTRIEKQLSSYNHLTFCLDTARKSLDKLLQKSSEMLYNIPLTMPVSESNETSDASSLKADNAPDSEKTELLNANFEEQHFISMLERQISSATKILESIQEVDSHLVEEWDKHHLAFEE